MYGTKDGVPFEFIDVEADDVFCVAMQNVLDM